MKKYLLVLPLVLAAAAASGEVTKNKTGTGFSNFGGYQFLNLGPVKNASSKRAGNGQTGSSDVPVYSAKRKGLKMSRLTQTEASTIALTLRESNGRTMRGIPVFAGDSMGSLRIVRYEKHVFGVVDGLRDPAGGSAFSKEDLGRQMSVRVTQRTGCALNGPPLLQLLPGHISKLSVPLACR